MTELSKRGKKLLVVFCAAVIVTAIIVYTVKASDTNTAPLDPKVTVTVPASEDATAGASPSKSKSTQDQLLYLIEEEKLAHDVYTEMYNLYGARVFGNILQSEQSHQDRVMALLDARNIPDPRLNELGKFNNQELQNLYDRLIAQGKRNETEAFKVGVTIEEKDIADITAELATAEDNDVIETLELLRSGSENHLRAFNRQL